MFPQNSHRSLWQVISAKSCLRVDGFNINVNEKISLTSRKCLSLNYRWCRHEILEMPSRSRRSLWTLRLKYLFHRLAIVLIYSVWRIPRGRSACHFRTTLRKKANESVGMFSCRFHTYRNCSRYFFNFVVEITAKINDDKWKSAKLVREKNNFHYGRKEISMSSCL